MSAITELRMSAGNTLVSTIGAELCSALCVRLQKACCGRCFFLARNLTTKNVWFYKVLISFRIYGISFRGRFNTNTLEPNTKLKLQQLFIYYHNFKKTKKTFAFINN